MVFYLHISFAILIFFAGPSCFSYSTSGNQLKKQTKLCDNGNSISSSWSKSFNKGQLVSIWYLRKRVLNEEIDLTLSSDGSTMNLIKVNLRNSKKIGRN